jgi:hypothetical protein
LAISEKVSLRPEMAVLNQPKWRKFLALKGEENKPVDRNQVLNGSKQEVVGDNAPSKKAVVEVAPKKRKRTEEEIAQRKAKKLKSKGKETKEWNQLSEDHQKNAEAEQKVDEKKSTAVENDSTSRETQDKKNASTSKPDAALLSTKAKEIAKVQRDEKLQDKKPPQKKRPNKREREALALEKKAEQVVEYLERYQAHVDSGSEWKFKKQHQNWIVKHLYKYPWKSNDLVIGYLKTVQGRSRERLVTDAKEVVRLVSEDEKAYSEDAVRRAQGVIEALKE